ncbi:V-type ATP synthase subunit I [Halonotius aquaticus]|uniref:A-type ATP synthase subunit I n=1 Tax=Halonotius aquaticus TaxID=2216978 RepID=A0A3A6Q4B6_9EURY|nr:V-type ATPase 116kDa subunit family protein [Halonotius aquaticus]RJX44127.1 V-type ATP synthase subunit I [Halonotius aquaticus]
MLRPEQMSKVSVTGSKRVIDDVIEAVHALNLLDLSDYDGSWKGFDGGRSLESAEETNEQLVTVRALKSTLGIEDDDAGQTRIVDREELNAELPELRDRINDLDDQRGELETQIREINEEIEAVAPFAELGLDLALLSGYDSLAVLVGHGDRDAIAAELDDEETINRFEIFTGGDTQAIFAQPAEGYDPTSELIADSLVGVEFTTLSVPDAETSPKQYVADLESEKETLEAELGEVEAELETVKAESAGFLLAAEEYLAIEAQKKEAPLSFATTTNAFVAEGWIPTDRYDDLAATLDSEVDGPVDVDEIERAEFKSNGEAHVEDHGSAADADAEAATDGGEVVADGGGAVTMNDDDPPIIQSNPGIVKPFEVLIEAVSRPKYNEFDPTVILFLTFPAFFGFMIGDLGYGLIYMGIGYYLYTAFDSQGFKSMGGVTIAAGVFTAVFGILYGELFGLHVIATYFWEGVVDLAHAPIEKGLSPAGADWARGWLVVSVLVGVVHLNIAWILGFIEDFQIHDLKHAIYENGSWILMMNGLWVWVFSDAVRGAVPEFIYTTFAAEGVLPLGFSGFPAMGLFSIPVIGGEFTIPLLVFVIGLFLLALGEPIEVVEFLNVLVNVLSYTRLAAVLLAKAGMAFTVNLLFFGVWVTETSHGAEWHFGLQHSPAYYLEQGTYHGEAVTGVLFPGLVHGEAASLLIGILVLVLGHILVLALGVTSAGLQAVRLEYVEFFGKFFDGGGREYTPFGYEREHTTTES